MTKKLKPIYLTIEQGHEIQLAESMRIAYLKKPYKKKELRHRSVQEIMEEAGCTIIQP